MKLLIITIVWFFSFSAMTQAAEWVEIDSKVYMDVFSYEYNSETKIARVWIKTINSEHFEMGKIKGKKVGHLLSYEEFDCARKQRRTISSVSYDSQSKVLASYDNPLSSWSNVIPDSRGELWYQLACNPEMTRD